MATLGAEGELEIPASSANLDQASVKDEAEKSTSIEMGNIGVVEIPASSTHPFQATVEDEVEESSSVETGHRPPRYTDFDPSPAYPEMRVTENVRSTSLKLPLRY